MKEILVLNLTRFGDLIQTTPLLRILKRIHPQTRITLAVQSAFAGITPLMEGFDRLVVFDQNEAARLIMRAVDPVIPYAHVEKFVAELEGVSYDLVINLTFNHMSAYLISLLETGAISGITATPEGQRFILGDWGLYFYSVMLGENRRYNRINLVDLFTCMGSMKPDGLPVHLKELPEAQEKVRQFLCAAGIGNDGLIGLQLGASETARMWPLENFAKLSDLLQGAGFRTVLLGSPGERALAEEVLRLAQLPPVDAVGKTSLPELFSLVKSCSLVVSNDTGTLHFAAAAGTPTVMLCIGPAFFQSTGPYSAGNVALLPILTCAPCRYSLNCPSPVCRDAVPVDSVVAASLAALGEAVPSEAFSGVRAYRSYFESDGYLRWEPLSNRDDETDILGDRYGALWKNAFAGGKAVEGSESLPHETVGTVAVAKEGLAIASRLLEETRRQPLNVETIAFLGEREAETWERLRLQGPRHPKIAPLIDYVNLMRENMTAQDLAALAAESCSIYETSLRIAERL